MNSYERKRTEEAVAVKSQFAVRHIKGAGLHTMPPLSRVQRMLPELRQGMSRTDVWAAVQGLRWAAVGHMDVPRYTPAETLAHVYPQRAAKEIRY